MKWPDQTVLVITALWAGTIGFVVSLWRGMVVERHGSWRAFIRGAIASVAVAVLLGWSLADTTVPMTMQAAVIGASAFVAEDILLGFAALAQMFRNNPIETLRVAFRAWRGRE